MGFKKDFKALAAGEGSGIANIAIAGAQKVRQVPWSKHWRALTLQEGATINSAINLELTIECAEDAVDKIVEFLYDNHKNELVIGATGFISGYDANMDVLNWCSPGTMVRYDFHPWSVGSLADWEKFSLLGHRSKEAKDAVFMLAVNALVKSLGITGHTVAGSAEREHAVVVLFNQDVADKFPGQAPFHYGTFNHAGLTLTAVLLPSEEAGQFRLYVVENP